jgi:hypothetical protein
VFDGQVLVFLLVVIQWDESPLKTRMLCENTRKGMKKGKNWFTYIDRRLLYTEDIVYKVSLLYPTRCVAREPLISCLFNRVEECGVDSCNLGQGSVTSFCEYTSEPSDSI